VYAFGEKYMLPLSHDEVVHGKGSMINKMPGDDWQQFSNLRLLYGYMFAHPGSKLLFMGNEFAQRAEWSHDSSLDWHLLQYGNHQGIKKTVQRLNRIYTSEKAFYECQYEKKGFEWIDFNDTVNSVISFIRRGISSDDIIIVICNFTPVVRHNYHIGVPFGGIWTELFNSDDAEYGGSGTRNTGELQAWEQPSHNRHFTLSMTLPPLGIVFMKPGPGIREIV
jgi:1,4-alpha-glucan branching enzyme